MWNYIFYEHRQADPQYQGILLWDLDNKEKRGWGEQTKSKMQQIQVHISAVYSIKRARGRKTRT